MEHPAIILENIGKEYTVYEKPSEKLLGLFLPDRVSDRRRERTFVALEAINGVFQKGEIIGLIGLNGSGKSTLSRIIAGITCPSVGNMKIEGNTAMLSASVGMNQHLTGRENIYYKCLLLGLGYGQIRKLEPQIEEFAEIGCFMDQPIRTYSSGMRSRLGFAISIHLEPDIFIVDEALAVGDSSFTQKCMRSMEHHKNQGKTIIFVSHAVEQMRGFCHRVMWLHKGRCVGIDTPENILKPYKSFAKIYGTYNRQQKQTYMPVYKGEQKFEIDQEGRI